MNAHDFQETCPDEVRIVAAAAGTTPEYFRQLAAGTRWPSRELALALERASRGRMTRLELLYPDEPPAPSSDDTHIYMCAPQPEVPPCPPHP